MVWNLFLSAPQHLLGLPATQTLPYLPPELWDKILRMADPLACLVFGNYELMAESLLEQRIGLKTLMDISLQIGHLALVRSLVALQPELASMRAAAHWGHLHIVQWLHQQFPAHHACDSTTAMEAAASEGHLAIVKWLHTHRREGCTACAMDLAALKNHLHVLRWLHEHRSEGCTTCALEYAAVNGHIETVTWLHAHKKKEVHVCIPMAIGLAGQMGHCHVQKFLRAEFMKGSSISAH